MTANNMPPKNPGRRRFLKFGLAGTGLLFLAGLWRYTTDKARPPVPKGFRFLTAQDQRIFAALAPGLIGKALPTGDRDGLIAEILADIDRLIAAMPPGMQGELRQLFDLLAFPPARIALTGIWNDWEAATEKEIEAFLDRWSMSALTLLQLAYAAIHDLCMAAWYDNPHAWSWIGYDGPPNIPDDVRKVV